MKQVPFIAVEGPIGAGKTSLAEKISSHFQFHLLKEIVEENPFLGKFYNNIEEWSFQTEMFFLCNRYKQLEDVKHIYLDRGIPVVSDYHIFKNMIFAKLTLQNHHYQKYEQIYRILTKDMPEPNILIYLDASLDTLLKRIQLRNRDVEQNLQADYLKKLSEDYRMFMEQFEQDYPDIPLIRINADELDFVHQPEDWDHLSSIIENHLKRSIST
ncbi:deoxyguanosine kinase [Melghiribacillus thermohalophilus]|uniref:Deoxyguanosine kinase n=1 Tax=Melghiribacillus thermohalophilus TaxID=1324956 RepID=A0A4R3N5Z2_9BACI|nr:deoxynucleoside kinase [Melghiribacillus thermohalophilus]TCT24648.1 deoxyguanosine kinase [Melghiribacillus thermohalophilus]